MNIFKWVVLLIVLYFTVILSYASYIITTEAQKEIKSIKKEAKTLVDNHTKQIKLLKNEVSRMNYILATKFRIK